MAAARIVSELKKHKIIPATKVILEKMGFAVGNATFPMTRYSKEEKNIILDGMRKAGLYM